MASIINSTTTSGVVVSGDNSGSLQLASNNGTTAVTVTTAQLVGIGTTSPASKLQIGDATVSTTNGIIFGKYNAASQTNLPAIRQGSFNGAAQDLILGASSGTGTVRVFTGAADSSLEFGTSSSAERMRVDSSGRALFGTTNANPGGTAGSGGIALGGNTDGNYYPGVINASADGNISLCLNRSSDDGNIVVFKAQENTEGTISVSGTTVSYNGGHLARYSQLPTGARDVSIVKGTVMSNLDAMCEWLKDGEPTPNEQLNKMKVSDVEGDANVAGVFVNWDNDDKDNTFDMNIAMTGDMIIRIAEGVTVQKGDLLMSAGDGTAKPQGDDIVRSKTIAKVTSNHVTYTYADGSYCVPCVLMAC
jgi:hypothetical protein